MNSHGTALGIARALALSTNPAFDHVQFYAHDTRVFSDGMESPVAEIVLPAVFVQVRFDALAGSGRVGRGTVEVTVESQSDDDSIALHSDREQAVRSVMADLPGLAAAFAEVSDEIGKSVELLGLPSLTENAPEVEARAFSTPYTYVVGVCAE